MINHYRNCISCFTVAGASICSLNVCLVFVCILCVNDKLVFIHLYSREIDSVVVSDVKRWHLYMLGVSRAKVSELEMICLSKVLSQFGLGGGGCLK